jgi:hypothetical protein
LPARSCTDTAVLWGAAVRLAKLCCRY